jgi:predicted phosphodiesterase
MPRDDADLLIVSGDLINSSFGQSSRQKTRDSFENVKSYLERVAERLAIDFSNQVFVVPGNHDFRGTGIGAFRKTAYDEFYKVFEKNFRNELIAPFRVAIFSFDSNGSGFLDLASGVVAESALIEAASLSSRWRDHEPSAWNEATRIAILHHHPMPIAATDQRDSITEFQEFLLLKNAGLFMTQMVHCGVDIVLHGHRHYPAFSKIRFPVDDREQVLSVVAAGSAGRKGLYPYAYNQIVLQDGDESYVERRSRSTATYAPDKTFVLSDYDESRRARFERLAHQNAALIRVKKYMRFETIDDPAGDLETAERFEGVIAYGDDPVRVLPSSVSGQTAYFLTRDYYPDDSQQVIRWVWDDKSAAEPLLEDGERRAHSEFDPPIGDTPISFRRLSKTPNAIHFNARERFHASRTEDEFISMTTRNAMELMVLSIVFPKSRFPQQLRVVVLNSEDHPDVREQLHVSRYFAYLSHASTAVLTVDHPLPGYTYQIRWSLPADEAAELQLTALDAGRATQVIGALLELRNDAGARAAIASLLGALGLAVDPGTDTRTLLFCYDDERGGLLLVAAGDSNAYDDTPPDFLIQAGRTIVGRAYKRREPVLAVDVGVHSSDAIFDGPLPFEKDDDHVAIFAIPIVFPKPHGRRVAVIAFVANDAGSSLLGLHDSRDDIRRVSELVETAFHEQIRPVLV